jgi:hypothetical protein
MGLDLTVTHRKLSLDSPPDAVTGWYPKSYTESTIDMYIQDRGASVNYLPAGWYPRLDAGGMTVDPVWEGDEIETLSGKFYEIKTIKEVNIADSFLWRLCDMIHLPLHGLTYPTTAPSVADARYNTKDYWETYIDDDELQGFSWIVCYESHDFPFIRVFKDKNIAIIFAISQPTTTPDIDSDLTTIGYNESVPTHILTLDTELESLAEQELRRIIREHPLGSIRTLDQKTSTIHNLGSTQIFDTTFTLNYWRDTS